MLAQHALSDKRNVVLCNAFRSDFKNLKCRRICEPEKVINFLNSLLENPYYHDPCLHVLIDEGLVLCNNKAAVKSISSLLAVARHYGVYITFITQISTKYDIPFKDLFNCRCLMKSISNSAANVVLGENIDTHLKEREFILLSDGIYRGTSYTVK